jgi:hypothetical protein
MGEFLPDYLVREQAAVGALVIFGIARVICAAIAHSKGWRISTVEKCFIAAAVLYCLLPLFDVVSQVIHLSGTFAELEGNSIGCAVALFCAPILSHRLGFE